MPAITRSAPKATQAQIIARAVKRADPYVVSLDKNKSGDIDENELKKLFKDISKNEKAMEGLDPEAANPPATPPKLSERARMIMVVGNAIATLSDTHGDAETLSVADLKKAVRAQYKYLMNVVKNPPSDEVGPFALLLSMMLLPNDAQKYLLAFLPPRDGAPIS